MTDDGMRALYQDVLVDHSRERHGEGLQPDPSAKSHQRNRSCGDEITLHLRVNGETIESVSWSGQGCAISQASASILHDLVTDLAVPEAARRIRAFQSMLHSLGKDTNSDELLGDAVALSGVAQYPRRVSCATLAWAALDEAIRLLPSDAAPDTAGTPE